MWSFSEVIDGMAEACRTFDTPVVSGNVSFYNETEGRGILPTPVIGMVGLVEDVRRIVQPGFKNEGDLIALLGETKDDLALSEYAVSVAGLNVDDLIAQGEVPKLDLDLEKRVQEACLQAAEAGLLRSAHDCADGGLAVTLAESCFSSHGREAMGAAVEINGELSPTMLLFSETPSRIVVSFAAADEQTIRNIASEKHVPFAVLGKVGGSDLQINVAGKNVVNQSVSEFEATWRNGLSNKLHPDALVAG
jgi:phosphoribosylformylglycinamidine synthase